MEVWAGERNQQEIMRPQGIAKGETKTTSQHQKVQDEEKTLWSSTQHRPMEKGDCPVGAVDRLSLSKDASTKAGRSRGR